MRRLTLHAGFLGTRIGRQTLLHFLSAALLPVLVSSLLGTWFVRQTLIREADERVERLSKSAASTLLRELTTLARETVEMPQATLRVGSPAHFTAAELAHLNSGRVLLRLSLSTSDPAADSIRMLRRTGAGRIGERSIGQPVFGRRWTHRSTSTGLSLHLQSTGMETRALQRVRLADHGRETSPGRREPRRTFRGCRFSAHGGAAGGAPRRLSTIRVR